MKEACISLIKKWVSYYNNDIIKLLKALDVEGKVDLCGEVVTEILNHVHIDTATECLLSRIENKGTFRYERKWYFSPFCMIHLRILILST